jgi:hypothetical protein
MKKTKNTRKVRSIRAKSEVPICIVLDLFKGKYYFLNTDIQYDVTDQER